MALLTPDDIQQALNIDLTNPQGRYLATTAIKAAVAYVESQLGFPLEKREVTTYFTGEYPMMWLPTSAPVEDVTLSTLRGGDYEDVDASLIRHHGNREVFTTASLPGGFNSVRVTYTTGWSAQTLPADIRQALIEFVALKIQEVANFSSDPAAQTSDGDSASQTGPLKRVTSGSVTLEYSTATSDTAWKAKQAQFSRTVGEALPPSIEEVIERYRVPFAI